MRRQMERPTPALFRNNDECVKRELSLEHSSHQNPGLSKKGDAALPGYFPVFVLINPILIQPPPSKLFSNVRYEWDVYASRDAQLDLLLKSQRHPWAVIIPSQLHRQGQGIVKPPGQTTAVS